MENVKVNKSENETVTHTITLKDASGLETKVIINFDSQYEEQMTNHGYKIKVGKNGETIFVEPAPIRIYTLADIKKAGYEEALDLLPKQIR